MNFNLGEQYNFLEENEILNNNIALLCYGGSHAYGTNIATSDVDIRGIASLMRDNVILCNDFETFVETTTDTTIYSLNKIIHLLTNANPKDYITDRVAHLKDEIEKIIDQDLSLQFVYEHIEKIIVHPAKLEIMFDVLPQMEVEVKKINYRRTEYICL